MVADFFLVPTHADYPWEHDDRVAGRKAPRAMGEHHRSGAPPNTRRPARQIAAPGDPRGRPRAVRRVEPRTPASLLRLVCWGLLAIGVTIGLVLVLRASPAVDDYGAIKPLHFLALEFARFMRARPRLPAGLLYIAVAGIPVTMLHELGHAVIARLLLGGNIWVTIGTAGRIADVRLGQIRVSINALSHPARRAGHASFSASRASARDIVMIALAGPAASLVGCGLTGWALSASPSSGIVHGLLWGATLGGAFGALNLIPFEFQERRGGPRHRSDGLLALRAASVARSRR